MKEKDDLMKLNGIATHDPNGCISLYGLSIDLKEEDVPRLFAKRMQDMGKAEYLVKSILEEEYFSCHFLSKHNDYWESKHEIENDKLDEARRKFSYLQDRLWDIVNILEFPEED